MKFLECPSFDKLNSSLSKDMGDYMFSGKHTGADKKLYKQICSSLSSSYSDDNEDEGISQDFGATPPSSMYFTPSSAPSYEYEHSSSLSEAEGTRMLFFLISTLNAAFPDYDFSDFRADSFRTEESLDVVTNTVDTHLAHYIDQYYLDFRQQMCRNAINEMIVTRECKIYSFVPFPDADPFDAIWSINYFFYNPKLKRIVFFTLRAISPENNDDAGMMIDEYVRFSR